MFAVFHNQSPQEKDDFDTGDTSEEKIRVLQMEVEPRVILLDR